MLLSGSPLSLLPVPIRAVLVRPADGHSHIFVACVPASTYYSVMTKSEWMPALVDGKEPHSPL